jgi:flavin reductase (DIM6/NTAB) family NADH-FMN oxidoreductase RutF
MLSSSRKRSTCFRTKTDVHVIMIAALPTNKNWSTLMHKVIEPRILYFGTPVVLISTLNEDGLPNLASMSSAWWINQSCMLGMSSRSKTVENLLREGQGALNLPSADLVSAVDRLALTTGRNPVPEYKEKIGYRYQLEAVRKVRQHVFPCI